MIQPWEVLARAVDYAAQGGAVMAPLALASVVMWTLIIHKALFLRRMRRKNMPRQTAARFIQENRFPDPRQYRGATALLVTEFLRRRQARPGMDRQVMDECVMAVSGVFDRRLAAISVLAASAPLLGLLGTVLGMISTFDVISLHGTGSARAMAGGVSEALISTQTGLLVAIPGLTLKDMLSSRALTLKTRVATMAMHLQRGLPETQE